MWLYSIIFYVIYEIYEIYFTRWVNEGLHFNLNSQNLLLIYKFIAYFCIKIKYASQYNIELYSLNFSISFVNFILLQLTYVILNKIYSIVYLVINKSDIFFLNKITLKKQIKFLD